MREVLDGCGAQAWITTAQRQLNEVRAALNALNVFPVADRDTGTNLTLTLAEAAKQVAELPADCTVGEVAQLISDSTFACARGNSGVILSQLLNGLCQTLAGHEQADGPLLIAALTQANAAAWKSVDVPVDGTILTVMSAVVEALPPLANTGDEAPTAAEVAHTAAAAARRGLAQTPAQMLALREAGVVDAGAAGLVVVLDALAAILNDEPMPRPPTFLDGSTHLETPGQTCDDGNYELMFVIRGPASNIALVRESLQTFGTSITALGEGDLWHLHVHLDDPQRALALAAAQGELSRVRIHSLHHTHVDHHQSTGTPHTVIALTETPGLATSLSDMPIRVLCVPGLDTGDGASTATAELAVLTATIGQSTLILVPGSLAAQRLCQTWMQDSTAGDPQASAGCVTATCTEPELLAALAEYVTHASAESAAQTVETAPAQTNDCVAAMNDAATRVTTVTMPHGSPMRLADVQAPSAVELVTILWGTASNDERGVLEKEVTCRWPDAETVHIEAGHDHCLAVLGLE